jgi:hypothetical protein
MNESLLDAAEQREALEEHASHIRELVGESREAQMGYCVGYEAGMNDAKAIFVKAMEAAKP